tara:strand:- start:31654 stop:32424 length:771 start_codon:yes stop_codon:yes gene_type:complete
MDTEKKNSAYTKKNFNEKLEKSSKIFTLLGLVLALFIVYVFIEFETKKIQIAILTTTEFNINTDYSMSEVFTKELLPQKQEQKKLVNKITAEEVELFDEINKVEEEEQLPEVLIENRGENIPVGIDSLIEIDIVDSVEDEVPFIIIENVPVFPGCKGNQDELKNCFSKHIRRHVNRNFDAGLGQELGLSPGKKKILVMFKIDHTGAITEIQARASHPSLEKEVNRVVKTLPRMIPGKQRGRAVSVRYSLPISFLVE